MTLADFVAVQIPAVIDTEGYDNPTVAHDGLDPLYLFYGGDSAAAAQDRVQWRRKTFLRNYRAQCAWNDKTAKLLTITTPWQERPVPQADWSPKGLRAWLKAQVEMPPTSAASKAFRKALTALGPDWQRDAAPTSAGGACAECLYTAMVAGSESRLLQIPHTCGKQVTVQEVR